MQPTPAQLRSELTTDPEGLGYAAAGDVACAALLNALTRPGYVPARHVSVSLATFPGLDGLIHWCLVHGTLPPEYAGNVSGVPVPFGVYALLRNLDRVDKSVDKGDLRASVADMTAGLVAAAASPAAAMIPAGFGAFLLAGEVKISRTAELWGHGAVEPSAADVEGARKGNN